MGSKPDMDIDEALGIAMGLLDMSIRQGREFCNLQETRKRQLTAEEKNARAKFDRLLAAQIVIIQHRAELREARALAAVRKGVAA